MQTRTIPAQTKCPTCHARMHPDDASCYKCGSAWDSIDVAFQVLENGSEWPTTYKTVAHAATDGALSIITVLRIDPTRGPVIIEKTRRLYAMAWHAAATALHCMEPNITIGDLLLLRSGLRVCGTHYIPAPADPCPICGEPAENSG